MLQIAVGITDVDYSAISTKVVPMILDWINDRNEHTKVSEVLSRFKNLPGKAAAAALKVLPQNIKDDIAVYLIRTFDNKILNSLHNFLRDKNLPLSVKEIAVVKEENIELSINFDEIDYNKLISTAYPRIITKFSEKEKYDKLFAVLAKLGGQSDKLIYAALEALSQDEKDELSICIINTYEHEILSVINTLVTEYELKLSFAGIEVRKNSE